MESVLRRLYNSGHNKKENEVDSLKRELQLKMHLDDLERERWVRPMTCRPGAVHPITGVPLLWRGLDILRRHDLAKRIKIVQAELGSAVKENSDATPVLAL